MFKRLTIFLYGVACYAVFFATFLYAVRAHLGQAYREYRERVPMLIPHPAPARQAPGDGWRGIAARASRLFLAHGHIGEIEIAGRAIDFK
jgi:hypothetical protein